MSNQLPPVKDDPCGADCLSKADAKLIVRETLIQIGVDLDDPIEFQRDCQFVRKVRTTHESIGMKIVNTAVGLVVTGTLAMFVFGIVQWIKKGS